MAESSPEAIRAKAGVTSHLVAETHDHDFWSIPCEYDARKGAQMSDAEAKLLMESAGGKKGSISFHLICTNMERLSHRAKVTSRVAFCGLERWESLSADEIGQIRDHLHHHDRALKPIKPRPHQSEATDDIVDYFEKKARGKYISPCGSGKSLVGYWVSKELGSKKILITVPSLALIRQTLRVWLRETVAHKQHVDWVCICSDESVGHQDGITMLQQDVGFPCLTDPEKIAAFLKKKHHGVTIVFSTYQSGKALAKACQLTNYKFDYAVLDEAHKTSGVSNKQFAHLLSDGNIAIKKRLFMTATERRYRGSSEEIVSMDDASVYGKTIHSLSFRKAMELDPPILSDYRIITISVSRKEIAKLIRENTTLQATGSTGGLAIDAQSMAALIALRTAMRRYPIKHAISFHSSIHRAEIFKKVNEGFPKNKKFGKMESFHVSGRTPAGQRAKTLKDFEASECALVTNARCLTEGVDLPAMDAVVFTDGGRGVIDTVQATGRVLRLHPGKKFGYVILPMLEGESPEDETGFESMVSTLRALAANDDRIVAYFRDPQQRGDGSEIFEVISDEEFPTNINLKDFTKAIELKCQKKLRALSFLSFEEARSIARTLKCSGLREYLLRYKNNTLPVGLPASPQDMYQLAGWVSWNDWLANKTPWLPFEEARNLARSLKCANSLDYSQLSKDKKLPEGLPSTPNRIYKDSGWISWNDWLGNLSFDWLPFKEARQLARSLKCVNLKGYRQYPKKRNLPLGLPASPNFIYKDSGWIGWNDWFGKRSFDWLPFKEARNLARSLKCNNRQGYNHLSKDKKLPAGLPASPGIAYRSSGWESWSDWFGKRSFDWPPFEEARKLARSLKCNNRQGYNQLRKDRKLHERIPANPNRIYKDSGWISWNDWFGNRSFDWLPFEEARKLVWFLKCANLLEYRQLSKDKKLPEGLPANPSFVYKDSGWVSWKDWFGRPVY